MVDPEIELDATERRELARTCSTPGFALIKKIAVSVVEQFRVDLDNTDSSDAKAVCAKHALSKAAGMFYARLLERLNHELASIDLESLQGETLPDETAALEMDSSELAQATKGMVNFFGMPDMIVEEEES